jgi:hypothetical protein
MSIKDPTLRCAMANFIAAMKDRLAEKEKKGYSGLDGKYPTENLLYETQDDLELLLKGRPTKRACIDIANRCMMIHYRLENGKTGTEPDPRRGLTADGHGVFPPVPA